MRLLTISLIFILLLSCQRKSQYVEKTKNPFYDKAFEFKDLGQTDSAFIYFNKAKDIFVLKYDNLGVGKCLLNMAIIATDKGDYYGGQEMSLNAINYFNVNKKEHHIYIKSNFNNLGLASEGLEQYTQALHFYRSALPFETVRTYELIVKNNIANIYRKTKEYQKAIDLYADILKLQEDKKEYSRVLSNLAYTKWLKNKTFNAVPELKKALKTRISIGDSLGINASYSHICTYYEQNYPDSAYAYALLRYSIAKRIHSADDQLESLEKLIKLSSGIQAKKYFTTYKILSDSIQNARNAAKNQFALIRYETEKHKADKLILQKENTERKYQIIILMATLLFSATGGIIWYKKRRQRLAQEAQQTIREHQLRTSKKVHDVVANGLYRVMAEIENDVHLDKDRLLGKIEVMYEKSRDISYENPAPALIPFHQKIDQLLLSFATGHTKISISGNHPFLWHKINSSVQSEIEYVLQELMINMRKHSGATLVRISFTQENNNLKINYSDNGLGMPKNVVFKNGLSSTETRIRHIHAFIKFENQTAGGLTISLSVPFSK